MHVYMNACFRRALLACTLPAARLRMLARCPSSRLLVIAGIYLIHVCMYPRRYVCMLAPRSVSLCAIFSSRVLACSPAVHHRVYSLSQVYFFCVYLALGFYGAAVFCVLVPCLPVLVVLACSPAVNECMFTRCPLLNMVASMPARRQIFARVTTTKLICSFSHTGVHACSTCVCYRRALPARALSVSPLTLSRLISARRPVLANVVKAHSFNIAVLSTLRQYVLSGLGVPSLVP